MIPNNLITAASFTPNSLQFPYAWVGHLPFAAWVIQEVKPKIFVELGTHSGNSYFTFCQAVAEAGLSTKCYAVDTWQGDEHASLYGDEIFAKVSAHHQEHYAEFSRLLRMTFDDAATDFADESIDLLHIDGLHTYEAVRHDFETWLPKLAPGAVVMFHDTNVRERNFGVWKLWEELQARYPNNLEFVHSHGLGVLQLNNASDDKKLEWLQPGSSDKQALITYFAALGSRQVERFELSELKQQIANLYQAVAERDRQITALYKSTSWRVTRSLRYVGPIWKKIRNVRTVVHRRLQHEPLPVLSKRTLEVLRNEGLRGLKARVRQQHYLITQSLMRDAPDMFEDTKLVTPPPVEAARPLEIDYCLSVPFSFVEIPNLNCGKIAAIIHLYYENLASEFRSYLSNVPGDLDVYISTTDAFKAAAIECVFAGWNKGIVEVRVVPNRGRDIAPKLVSFSDIYGRYDYVLHMHGKQSSHTNVLWPWRHFLLESLLGTPQVVASVLYAFEQNPNLGMIAAQHFEPMRHWTNWGGNFQTAQKLAAKMGFTLDERDPLDFPSGSMFWARTLALKPLLDIGLTTEDFDIESNQIDATLAHAIERIFFHACEHKGFNWIKIARPELYEHTMNIVDIQCRADLSTFFSRHIFQLLNPHGVKPRSIMPDIISNATPQLLNYIRSRALGMHIEISPDTHGDRPCNL